MLIHVLVVCVVVTCARADAERARHGDGERARYGDGERARHGDDRHRADYPIVPYPYPQHGVVSHSHPHEVARQNEILRETLSPVRYQPQLILDYRYQTTGRHAVQGPGGQYILLPRGSAGEPDGVLYDSLLHDRRPHRVHRPDPHPVAEHVLPGTHEERPRPEIHHEIQRPQHEIRRPQHEVHHERPQGYERPVQGHGHVPVYQSRGHVILSTHAPAVLRKEHRQEYQNYGWLQQGIVQ